MNVCTRFFYIWTKLDFFSLLFLLLDVTLRKNRLLIFLAFIEKERCFIMCIFDMNIKVYYWFLFQYFPNFKLFVHIVLSTLCIMKPNINQNTSICVYIFLCVEDKCYVYIFLCYCVDFYSLHLYVFACFPVIQNG
jgi:hypothetical protein